VICTSRNAALRGVTPDVLAKCPRFTAAQAMMASSPRLSPTQIAELDGVIRAACEYLITHKQQLFSALEMDDDSWWREIEKE